ncbi:MAG: threonine--tRNA ligase [Candidatus Colwellbacteria bacterium]|jgi:threonyl-tRNA synthetase|nr:threonine--tRNA ligase [Candidatus Colwellbacteria bacterium]MCK9497693.1 threonine--tRNA ligase [Candidatus Colwellbacteria bacterium]MDD3752618.1 threonine--tRNA ligase [Candidatus Colwellbacteria bacterium]MDD4819138.1 threonine--tRNA ligase [Candidatus Colwellbacteria bacterium]
MLRSKNNIEKIRHSLSHILASAVKEKFPKSKLGIGPAIENGFYYDFDVKGLSEEHLPELEKRMKEIIKSGIRFSKEEATPAKAKKIFADEPYKLELIDELKKNKKPITIYKTYIKGEKEPILTDLCSGPHIRSSSEIDENAFKLAKIAGAYWKGEEKNKMLTRIYGYAFSSKKELDDYLNLLEEAEKRDHRKLGKELNLFNIDPMVGLGLVMWQPKGAMLWRTMEDFWYKEHLKAGYELVRTPHIGSRQLWETSGHWGFYSDSMYPPIEVGLSLEDIKKGKKSKAKEEYLVKPMNCPFHVVLYNSTLRSYKDLPLRWAECGTVYRYEKSGELSGLTRVRGFTQDDAHIICTEDQVKNELIKVVKFIKFIFGTFGFKDYKVYLSMRDPKDKKKYTGSDKGWKFTEKVLEEVAKEEKLDYEKELGEAAFYGPKLDFKIKDVLGREWQCSTLQFDFNLPERFNMSFINNKGKEERPYMLHRALFGSFERFIGLLIEHFAGAFPTWLAPIQAAVIPISDKQADYAKKVSDILADEDIRFSVFNSNETLGKRIREAEMQKIPYLLIVGEKEVLSKTISVRKRSEGDLGVQSTQSFIEMIHKDINSQKEQ